MTTCLPGSESLPYSGKCYTDGPRGPEYTRCAGNVLLYLIMSCIVSGCVFYPFLHILHPYHYREDSLLACLPWRQHLQRCEQRCGALPH